MKGPIPLSIYPELRQKYEEGIVAAHSVGDSSMARDLAKSIEQEFVDAAKAQGLPGQSATPQERIAIDVATAREAQAAAKGESDILVTRALTEAAVRASERVNESS